MVEFLLSKSADATSFAGDGKSPLEVRVSEASGALAGEMQPEGGLGFEGFGLFEGVGDLEIWVFGNLGIWSWKVLGPENGR